MDDTDSTGSQQFDSNELLSIGSKQITNLFLPVTICMLLTIISAYNIPFFQSTNVYLIYTPFHTENASVGTETWQTLANVGIMLSVVIVFTFILLLLFKYECYKLIEGWLIFTTVFLLFVISSIYFYQVFLEMNIFVDYITFAIFIWNFGVVGVMCINWKGPLLAQQMYLIFISLQMALIFLRYLPKWTCWLLLGVICIWDLIAVLCPKGPLRMLIELSSERQQPLMPALIYSTTACWSVVTMVKKSDEALPASTETSGLVTNEQLERPPEVLIKDDEGSKTQDEMPRIRQARTEEGPSADTNPGEENVDGVDWRAVQEEARKRGDHGVMLGLGDFIFYSLLIGRATLDSDGVTVVACYIAILIGMCTTIVILGLTRKALPALPISVLCALLFYFLTSIVISSFVSKLFSARILI